MTVEESPMFSVSRIFRSLFALAALLVMPDAVLAAVTIAQPVPTQVAAQAPRPAVADVSPLSASSIPSAQPTELLGGATDFVRPAPANTSFHHMTKTPVFGGLSVVEIALIGACLIAMTAFARRRHRRLVGWGFMPERSPKRTPSEN